MQKEITEERRWEEVAQVNGTHFLLLKEDLPRFTQEHREALEHIGRSLRLAETVRARLDPDGRLVM